MGKVFEITIKESLSALKLQRKREKKSKEKAPFIEFNTNKRREVC